MPLQIGLNVSTSAAPGRDPATAARRAEQLGFDFVSATDHLHGAHPTFETWTLLTWMAAATKRVRLVSNVLGLPYRSPAVLAKMAESLDRLSGGRLVLGLGAGGADPEFQAFGLPVRSPGEKVTGLSEAIDIIRGMWTEPTFTLDGLVHQVEAAQIEPKPEHRIPIWVGGYGPRSMRMIGRQADGWLPSLPFVAPERVLELRAIIRRSAQEAGRDPADLTYAYNIPVRIGAPGNPEHIVAGDARAVVARLEELVETLGLTAVNLWPAGESDEQVDAIAEQVLPLLH
jgi:probable F420-dependent oxidoreductase